MTPGEAFDAPGFIRISYATSMENLREGSRRLLEFVAKHAPADGGGELNATAEIGTPREPSLRARALRG